MAETLQSNEDRGLYFDGFVTFDGEYIQSDDFEAKWAAWEREAEPLPSAEKRETE